MSIYLFFIILICIIILFFLIYKIRIKNIEIERLMNINKKFSLAYIDKQEELDNINFTVKIYDKIIDSDFSFLKPLNIKIVFFDNKRDYYFLFLNEILKYKVIFNNIPISLVKNIGMIIKIKNNLYYIESHVFNHININLLSVLLRRESQVSETIT